MARRFHYGPLVSVVALAGIGYAIWHYYPREAALPASPTTARPVDAAPVAAAPARPDAQFPIAEVQVPPEIAGPLPALEDSDGAFLDALSTALGGPVGEWIVQEFVIAKLVATIDNIPNAKMMRNVYAARPVAGTLAVAEADGRLWLDAGNSARYDAGVALLERVDLRQAVGVYVRFHPLFQQAYRDIAPPGATFNDRLVAVIDHLLAAPEVEGPLELQRAEGGRLRFADPRREGASVGHKAMWRLGPDHAARVKARLRELRAILAGQRPRVGGG